VPTINILLLRSHRFIQMTADRFKHKETTDIILRSFYETYNELGDGFLEKTGIQTICI